MAIEDAACLGLVFSKKNFSGDIREALETYETVRKPRATKVQAASARARENINERIGKGDLGWTGASQADFSLGFSSNTNNPLYKVSDEANKLTIEQMNL